MVRLPGLAFGLLVQSEVFDGRQVGMDDGIRRRRWARSWRLDLFETLEKRIDLTINAETVVRSWNSDRGTVIRSTSIVHDTTEVILASV
jgi:transcriptional regulator NrdR family protein